MTERAVTSATFAPQSLPRLLRLERKCSSGKWSFRGPVKYLTRQPVMHPSRQTLIQGWSFGNPALLYERSRFRKTTGTRGLRDTLRCSSNHSQGPAETLSVGSRRELFSKSTRSRGFLLTLLFVFEKNRDSLRLAYDHQILFFLFFFLFFLFFL